MILTSIHAGTKDFREKFIKIILALCGNLPLCINYVCLLANKLRYKTVKHHSQVPLTVHSSSLVKIDQSYVPMAWYGSPHCNHDGIMNFLQLIQKPWSVQYGSFEYSPFILYQIYIFNHQIPWKELLDTASSNSIATFLVFLGVTAVQLWQY